MLSKIPEEIFCCVFYSSPVPLQALPQPPGFTSVGDETFQYGEIHSTMAGLIESTNACKNAVDHFKYMSTQISFTCKEAVVSPGHVIVEHASAEPQFLGVQVGL